MQNPGVELDPFIAPDEEALLGRIQAQLGIALPLVALPYSISRVSTAERQPIAARRGKRRSGWDV